MVPEFVDRICGSRWQSAQPTGSKWVRALPGRKAASRTSPSPVLEMFTCGWYDGVVRGAELPEREDVKQGGKTNVD